MSLKVLRWPYPCKWAFSLIDDTDCSTLPAVRTVYEHCLAHGIHATKTLWMHEPRRGCGSPHAHKPMLGDTLDDESYLDYCRDISRRGIELCLHDLSAGNNLREEIIDGFSQFEREFGYTPRVHVFHSHNCDHIYWGARQYRSPLLRALARFIAGPYEYYGQDPSSPHYWSDVCRNLISYVRLYRTRSFNVLRCNPSMPYHIPGKPDVKLWFSASASRARLERLDERALTGLAREDGALLLYAYSSNLVDTQNREVLRPEVSAALSRIGAREDCWRTTVSQLLDRCLATKNVIVTERRHAYVVSNPTAITIPDFQFRSPRRVLFLPSGAELSPDREQRYQLRSLDAGQCTTLYFSAEAASSGDPGGIPALESFRMMLEELWHLAWKRPYQLRRQLKRRWRR